MIPLPKNKTELLAGLKALIESDELYDVKLLALGIAYIANDICPDDRTTKQVFRREKK